MHVIWGVLVILAGLSLLICGRRKIDSIFCRFLVARSRLLWGDNVHYFHQIAGAIIIVFGILIAAGVFN
jgi:hypothetical protein